MRRSDGKVVPNVQFYPYERCIEFRISTREVLCTSIFVGNPQDICKYPKLQRFWGQTSVPLIINICRGDFGNFGQIGKILYLALMC